MWLINKCIQKKKYLIFKIMLDLQILNKREIIKLIK